MESKYNILVCVCALNYTSFVFSNDIVQANVKFYLKVIIFLGLFMYNNLTSENERINIIIFLFFKEKINIITEILFLNFWN